MSPAVTRVATIETRRARAGRGWVPVVRELRARGYDVAFDAQGLTKSAALARLSGARRVIGWTRPHVREALAAWGSTERVDPGDVVHVIDKNLALLRAVGIEGAPRALRLDEGTASPHLDAFVSGRQGPYAIINPGGNWPNKRWPPDRFGELAAWLRDTHGLYSLVLWGPGDEPLADAVAAASDGAATRAPATSLADIVALARRAALMVSGDTGPAHFACAVGTPVVGIYGPTDPRRNGPWHPDDQCVSRFDACACHHQRACRAPRWCLLEVGVDEVRAAVTRRLALAGAPPRGHKVP
jgi:ADP-heptose:LPS heptosyltransferase